MKLLTAIYLLSISASAFGSLKNHDTSYCDSFKYSTPLDNTKTGMFEAILKNLSPPKESEKPEKLNEKLVSLEIKPSSSNIPWEDKYSDFLFKTLSGPSFDPLLDQKIDEEDLKKINCPQFNELDKDQKKKFYIVFLAAIAEASSDYNTNDETYSPSDKSTNYGLLQIDPESAKRHAGSVVIKDIGKDELTNYVPNLQVGAYILKHQIAGKIATGRLFPKNVYYWPTLKNSQSRILKTFAQNSSNLPFCKGADLDTDKDDKESKESKESKDKAPVKPLALSKNSDNPSPAPTSKKVDAKSVPASTSTPPAPAPAKTKAIGSGGTGKKPSPPKPPAPKKQNATTLDDNAFKARLNSLGSNSTMLCAKGVRKSLNALFGRGPENGPNAKDYDQDFLQNWRTESSCYKESADNGSPQNYDIHVLEGRASPDYGHIEIYFDGHWYSDFQQDTSLWNDGTNDFDKKRLYRFSNCEKRTSFIFHFLLNLDQKWISSVIQPFSKKLGKSNEI